jgi:hypothetical protein
MRKEKIVLKDVADPPAFGGQANFGRGILQNARPEANLSQVRTAQAGNNR